MNEHEFPALPAHSRLTIFGASRLLTPADRSAMGPVLDGFVGSWKAHGAPVFGAWCLAHDRFLLVAVDETQAALSGCSIDGLTRTMKLLGGELGVDFLDGGAVYFRGEQGVSRVSREEFGRLAGAGRVTAATVVFDNTLATLSALRSGRWEVPAGTAWHARAFHLQPAAAGTAQAPPAASPSAAPPTD